MKSALMRLLRGLAVMFCIASVSELIHPFAKICTSVYFDNWTTQAEARFGREVIHLSMTLRYETLCEKLELYR